jgi:hypothetical protein
VFPKNTGNLTKGGHENGQLNFAGGKDKWFMTEDVEVWGLH